MNHTIYFRKDVWEEFKEEPDKSKVINALIKEHYMGNPPTITLPELTKKLHSCCYSTVPCVHWLYDEESREYTNTITGEVREI